MLEVSEEEGGSDDDDEHDLELEEDDLMDVEDVPATEGDETGGLKEQSWRYALCT